MQTKKFSVDHTFLNRHMVYPGQLGHVLHHRRASRGRRLASLWLAAMLSALAVVVLLPLPWQGVPTLSAVQSAGQVRMQAVVQPASAATGAVPQKWFAHPDDPARSRLGGAHLQPVRW